MDRQTVLSTTVRAGVAALLITLVVFPARPAAQVPGPYKPSVPTTPAAQTVQKKAAPEDLAAVKLLLQGGQFEAALDAARALEPDADVLRLRIDASLGLEKPGEALAEYSQLVKVLGKDDLAVLETIAKLVVRQALTAPDPLLAIEACTALMGRGPDPCAKPLVAQVEDPKAPFALRIIGLAALARASTPGSLEAFQKLAATAAGPQWRSVADATEDLPESVAVPLLARALASDDEGVQFAAAGALGRHRTPEARAALEKYLQVERPGVVQGAARLSLARLGDDRWFKEFVAVLPELDGDMLLEMGLLLKDRNDPRGIDAITRVARGQHDLLRVAAAARLPVDSDVAARVFSESMTSENPYTRAATLDAFRSSPLLTLDEARQFLMDVAPWVRVRAARVLFSRMGSPAPPRPAKRP